MLYKTYHEKQYFLFNDTQIKVNDITAAEFAQQWYSYWPFLYNRLNKQNHITEKTVQDIS